MDDYICVYCGSDGGVREHVIPASYLGDRTYDENKQWIVDACETCNTLAGAATFFSIPEKADFISRQYKSKYKKILKIPHWTEGEIKQLGYRMRVGIEQALIAKRVLLGKLQHLETVIEYPRDFMRPKWVEAEWRYWKERQEEIEKWEEAQKRKRIKLSKSNGSAI